MNDEERLRDNLERMIKEPLCKMMKLYPDEVRHPLVVDNPDWDAVIVPALIAATVIVPRCRLNCLP